jgi:hypothetical protein
MLVLAAIWAIAEYNNAGGWPTNGFSQSSGIPNVWNYWMIYPAIVWVLATAADAWWVFGHNRSPKTRSRGKSTVRPVGADLAPRGVARPVAARPPIRTGRTVL